MNIHEDITRIFETQELPVAEKIFLLKHKGSTYPEFFQLTQYLVQQVLSVHKALVISDKDTQNGVVKDSEVFHEKIFKTRRIGVLRNEICTIRNVKKISPDFQKFSVQKSPLIKRKANTFFSDIPHKKTAALLGLTFALAMSITPDLSLMASTTDISIIPTSGQDTKGTLAYAFQTGDFDFKHILEFGIHLIRLAGILAGMVYLIMNVWAGIQYIIGATMDDKESGKNILVNALLGFGLIIFSWIGVDIVISFLTTE